MKNKLVFLLSLLSVIGFGQTNQNTKSYIYKTYQDFVNNKPSVIINPDKGEKLTFTFPAGLQTRLKVKKQAVKKVYKAGEIWGFKKDGFLYRYYQPKSQKDVDWEYKLYYKVIYNKDVVVYSVFHAESGLYAGGSDYESYYYSNDLMSAIKKVKDKNLTQDFKNNPKLIEKIKGIVAKDKKKNTK